jgi:hypothetical protein
MAHLRPKLPTPGQFAKSVAALLFGAACLSAQAPPLAPPSPTDPDGVAKLLSFTGQISVERSGYAWALNVGSAVKRQEVIVTGSDGWGLFQVADGSKFEVFPNGRYVFRANQGDWRDLLEVWLGKVRVQIEHFGGLPNNNKVTTPTAVISVRGTIFTVAVDDQLQITTVADEEGSVVVAHRLVPGKDTVLTPGESVVVYKNQPLARSNIDKAGLLQRAVREASDVFYRVAVAAQNGSSSTGHVGTPTTSPTGSAGDKNNGASNGSSGAAPPPPTAPPPPPPH